MSVTTNIILQAASDIRMRAAHLKRVSPVYPEIYIEGMGNLDFVVGKAIEIYFSTLVIFEHEGKKYKRHHIESYIFTGDEEVMDIRMALEKLKEACLLTIKMGTPVNVETPFGVIKDDEII